MEHYLRGGKRAVWPHVTRIRHMLALETTLTDCWNKVKSHRRRKAQQNAEALSLSSSTKSLRESHEQNAAETGGGGEDVGLSDPDDDEVEREERFEGSVGDPCEAPNSIASSNVKEQVVQHQLETPPVKRSIVENDSEANIETHYRQLEWEYRRLQTRFERLRSENLDLRRRIEDIRSMCAPSCSLEASC